MNEMNENADAVLGGSGNAGTPDDGWKAKYEEMERKYHAEKVESGRLKKTAEELEAARRELAELKAGRRGEELANALTEEERQGIAPELVTAAAKMVDKGISQVREQYELSRRKQEEADAESRKRSFVDAVNGKYPGFFADVSAGGRNAEQWQRFMRFNKGSVNSAYAEFDLEAMSYLIEKFYTDHLGVSVPSGSQEGAAAPDPRGTSGGKGGVTQDAHSRTYTQQEYDALVRKAEDARSRGDFAEYSKLTQQIDDILAERRIRE